MSARISNRLNFVNPKCSKLKKGDEVKIISGSHRGSTGKVERVVKKSNRVYVSGVNLAKKHSRPTSENQAGGIIDKQMPLHISNVLLIDPKSKKTTRISYKIESDKKKVRVARKSNTVLN